MPKTAGMKPLLHKAHQKRKSSEFFQFKARIQGPGFYK